MDGISSKMMVHRVTEFSREVTQMQKQGEQMNAAAGQQVKAQAEENLNQVVDVYEASQAAIRQRQRERRRQKEQEMEYVEIVEEVPAEEEAPQPRQAQAPVRRLDIHI